ncbi:hypothetical protein [Yoonia sp.]|uniref:hypothetical protein n=1 Tax=Yoonia sp. TaxID=2212373 RepID=UPI002FD8EFE4
MKTGILLVTVLVGLAACAPTVVTPPRGIGFDDATDRAIRDAQLSSPQSIVPQAQVNSIPGTSPIAIAQGRTAAPQGGVQTSDLAAAGIGSGQNLGGDPNRVQGLDASPNNPAPQLAGGGASLSDEQNFDAVASRETIESDAERRAAQAAIRQQVEPTALPDRPANVGPNIVEYALNAPNVKGQEWYSRSLLTTQGRFQRNCAEYRTDDDAQRDFLARGGPEIDRRGLDPDGDGFACGWDPAPFIAAFRN